VALEQPFNELGTVPLSTSKANGCVVIGGGVNAAIVKEAVHDPQVTVIASPTNRVIVDSRRIHPRVLQQALHNPQMAATASRAESLIFAS
jgi:hypothetical protein